MSRASVRGFYMLMGGGAAVPLELLGDFPGAYVGIAYDHSLDIVGGSGPFVGNLEAGSIPPGLVLEIHQADARKLRLHGMPVGRLKLLGLLPPATIGIAYSERLQVENDVGVVAASIAAGALPAWMTMTWHSATSELEFHGTP